MDIVWLGFYVGCYWPIDFESISRLVCHNLTALERWQNTLHALDFNKIIMLARFLKYLITDFNVKLTASRFQLIVDLL